jgi:isoamylase
MSEINQAWPYLVVPGRPHPLGATVDSGGVNFSLYSQHATGVELLLFRSHTDTEPAQVIALDPVFNETFFFWHCRVVGLRPGAFYAYRVQGPWDPANGHRFDSEKVLNDPYTHAVERTLWQRGAACQPGSNLATSMRCVVVDVHDYNWEDDAPLQHPMQDSVIYEMHVGGFTKSPSARVTHPGTFAGVIEKIPYLKTLGITAVELLPVFGFDQSEGQRSGPGGVRLSNYWGYSTVDFFAPAAAYCVSPEEGQHLREFRDMVKALHRAGIEVILDVVFNHTSEGNQDGPVISFRGIDNSVYYHLVPEDKQYYMNFSGCGNSVNCNHPAVEKFILECLEFWVREMHVDGFRFDEGSILSRGEDGAPLKHPPVLWGIELEESLMDTKVIAEAWDAAGLYQIGYFPGPRFAEWNGRFRDDIRRFVAGQPGLAGVVATRLAGSADLYQRENRTPVNSINFITCHDGFTLNDLVSYNKKHNEANGEDNRDGVDDNLSWNCGWEGDTDNAAVNALRERQVKNFAAILLLAQGVPMICGGDEIRRTQRGNNNCYCQDNGLSWHDWSNLEAQAGVLRFFSGMIALRQRHDSLRRQSFFSGSRNARGLQDIAWHGCQLGAPGFNDPACRVLSCTLGGPDDGEDLHLIFNMDDQALGFDLPVLNGRSWLRAVDTSLPSPQDIAPIGEEALVNTTQYLAQPRSVVVLISRLANQANNQPVTDWESKEQ